MNRNRWKEESGVVALVGMGVLFLLVIIAAFQTNVGYLTGLKEKHQFAADSAALSGAAMLPDFAINGDANRVKNMATMYNDGQLRGGTEEGDNQSRTNFQSNSDFTLSPDLNRDHDLQNQYINAGAQHIGGEDVELGVWDPIGEEFRPSLDKKRVNAVKVTLKSKAKAPFLPNLFPSTDLQVEAVAMMGSLACGVPIWPIALLECELKPRRTGVACDDVSGGINIRNGLLTTPENSGGTSEQGHCRTGFCALDHMESSTAILETDDQRPRPSAIVYSHFELAPVDDLGAAIVAGEESMPAICVDTLIKRNNGKIDQTWKAADAYCREDARVSGHPSCMKPGEGEALGEGKGTVGDNDGVEMFVPVISCESLERNEADANLPLIVTSIAKIIVEDVTYRPRNHRDGAEKSFRFKLAREAVPGMSAGAFCGLSGTIPSLAK